MSLSLEKFLPILETPMTVAATLPRPGAVILALVGGGAFIDYRNRSGMTPLHVATMQGNKDAVRVSHKDDSS